MSNLLSVRVLDATVIGASNSSTLVLASDTYGKTYIEFDSTDELHTVYPTKDSLILAILQMPEFEDAAVINNDGTYTLTSISYVDVEGYD